MKLIGLQVMLYKDDVKSEKQEKSIRLPLDGERIQRWNRMIAARKINQQTALYAMIDWIVQQDEQLQLIVLGQVEPSPDAIDMILARYRSKLAREQAVERGLTPDQMVNTRDDVEKARADDGKSAKNKSGKKAG